jgi:hypothetical protein
VGYQYAGTKDIHYPRAGKLEKLIPSSAADV